jgi:drug/metabolite transporter (DMT)-like permease
MCEAKTIADKGIDAGFRLRRWAVAALVLGTVATALNPVFVRLSDLEPAGSAFHRMLWALPLMGAWLFRESRVKGSPRVAIFKSARSVNDRWLLVLCGVFFAADLTALHWSIQLTSAANAILFLNAQPLYVVFGAWLLFGERVGARFLAGAATAMAGAVLMLGESAQFGGDRLLGDGLGIAAGVFYGGYILVASELRARASSAAINTWTCLIACPLLLAVALVTGQGVIPGTFQGLFLLIGLGVISQACGQGLIVWGMAHLTAGYTAVVLLLAPVASAGFAWALLSESLSGLQVAGILVVLGGVFMAHRASLAQTAGAPRDDEKRGRLK